MSSKKIILSVRELSISFQQEDRQVHIVKNISFDVEHNKTIALVGESGSGKSLTAHSIMRLLPYPLAFHPSGDIWFSSDLAVCARTAASKVECKKNNSQKIDGCIELLSRPLESMTAIRGHDIGMIFQEPMSALNPLHTIEQQINESVNLGCFGSGKRLPKKAMRNRV